MSHWGYKDSLHTLSMLKKIEKPLKENTPTLNM